MVNWYAGLTVSDTRPYFLNLIFTILAIFFSNENFLDLCTC